MQKKGCPALVVLVAYAAACRPWVLNCIEPQRTRCASPKRMLLCVRARIAPKMSLAVSGVSLQQTPLPCQEQGQGERHCLAFIVCLHLLCIRSHQVVLRAKLKGLPLQVLGQPAQGFDGGAARGAVHCPVLALAREGCMQKVTTTRATGMTSIKKCCACIKPRKVKQHAM